MTKRIDARQRRVGAEVDLVHHGTLAHLEAPRIAEERIERLRLAVCTGEIERRPVGAGERGADVAVGGVHQVTDRIPAEREFGRAAVLVDQRPALQPPGALQLCGEVGHCGLPGAMASAHRSYSSMLLTCALTISPGERPTAPFRNTEPSISGASHCERPMAPSASTSVVVCTAPVSRNSKKVIATSPL